MKSTLIFFLFASAVLLGFYFCYLAYQSVHDVSTVSVFFTALISREVEHG